MDMTSTDQQLHHPLRCQCGEVQGYVVISAAYMRGICYCKDCQSFAHFLGKQQEVLNDLGGTDIVPVAPRGVVFTQGKEWLACMKLGPKGLLRWYTKCCNTPIGNTSTNNKLPYAGLVHDCLEQDGVALEQSFGPVRMQVNPQSAKGPVSAKSAGTAPAMIKWIVMMLREWITGSYRQSPFFVADTGEPVVLPMVLTLQERNALRSRL